MKQDFLPLTKKEMQQRGWTDVDIVLISGDAYVGKRLREIPKTLRDATAALKKSKMLRAAFGDDVVDHYVHTAEWEQFEYDRRITDWELMRGFERY